MSDVQKMNLKQVRAVLATIALRLHQDKILVADRKKIGQELLTEIIPSLQRTRKVAKAAKLGKRQISKVLTLSSKRRSGISIARELGLPHASVLAAIRENRVN